MNRRWAFASSLESVKNTLSTAAGLVLVTSGGFGGEPTRAETAIRRESAELAAATEPRKIRRYAVSWDRVAQARHIICQSISRYRQWDGYEGHLGEAAWQLERIGTDAWCPLRDLAFSRLPEVEYFLGTILRLPGVNPRLRLGVLRIVAKNPDPNTRSRLLELIDEMDGDDRFMLLRALAAPTNPDDDVTDRARLRLSEITS